MSDLKLAKLPDRTPIKLAITIAPDLHQALQEYAALYAETYRVKETVADLVPAMLNAFLLTDRSFTKARMLKGTPS